MTRYRLWFAGEAVQSLLMLADTESRLFAPIFDVLESEPLSIAMGCFDDETGNDVHWLVVTRWVLTYVIDDSAKRVEVRSLETIERPR